MGKSRLRRRIVLSLVVLLLAAGAYFGYQYREYIQQLPIGVGVKAKFLCSGIFVSGRDEASVLAEDVGFHPLLKIIKHKVDFQEKSVTAWLTPLRLFKKKAVYLDKLGSVLLADASEETVRAWAPNIPEPEPKNPASVPWPMGDLMPTEPWPAAVDQNALSTALDKIFSEPDPARLRRTRATAVVYEGRLIAERYASGYSKDTPLISWSMAKSHTNALIGILVGQGRFGIAQPAPVPEWQGAGDPRRAITIDQLLRMSPGLQWYEAYAEHPVSDVNTMLFLKPDMAAFAASMPLKNPPDTVFEYSTGTANILNRIIRQTLGSQAEYWAFPRKELFNRIGMRSAVLEPDASGTYSGGSYIYANARDFARFGLLYLNDGVWNGERVLPEGWVSYTTTPSSTAKEGEYGAHFWLNRGAPGDPTKRMFPKLPEDAFFCEGYQGQMIAIIPSARLVIVRLGMTWKGDWGAEEFLGGVLAAIKKEKP
jgi:CubicO group peptidase (beta-lactamase class C family)